MHRYRIVLSIALIPFLAECLRSAPAIVLTPSPRALQPASTASPLPFIPSPSPLPPPIGVELQQASRFDSVATWSQNTLRLTWSPDSSKLALLMDSPNVLALIEATSGENVWTTVTDRFPMAIDFSHDDSQLIVSRFVRPFLLFDAQTGEETASLASHTCTRSFNLIDYSLPSGMLLLASSSDQTMIATAFPSSQDRCTNFMRVEGFLLSLAPLPGTTLLITYFADVPHPPSPVVLVWDLSTSRLTCVIPGSAPVISGLKLTPYQRLKIDPPPGH